MNLFGFESRSERIARESNEREEVYKKECETAKKRRECNHSWCETSQRRFNASLKEGEILRRCTYCGKEEWW